MILSILLTLFIAATRNAQFSGIAPTADGTSLYFATNYVQKNTGQPDLGEDLRH